MYITFKHLSKNIPLFFWQNILQGRGTFWLLCEGEKCCVSWKMFKSNLSVRIPQKNINTISRQN